MKKNRERLNKGLTLIEVTVAIGIVSVIAFIVAAFQKDVFDFYNVTEASLDAQIQGLGALRTMVPEIREASPSSLGAYPIAAAGTSTLTFFSDIDDDLLKEQVRYFISNGKLMRGIIKPKDNPLIYDPADEILIEVAVDVANSTSTPLFEYFRVGYDNGGAANPLSYPLDILSIRLIKINIVIDKHPNRPPSEINFSSQVSIRNLKDNL